VSKGYPYVLGFNEPDNTVSRISPSATAISLLPSFDNPAIQVGTPASQASATGQTCSKTTWRRSPQTPPCATISLPFHWYAGTRALVMLPLPARKLYQVRRGLSGNRPIWITEWSCLNLSAPTAAGVLAFYQGALAVFAKHPRFALRMVSLDNELRAERGRRQSDSTRRCLRRRTCTEVSSSGRSRLRCRASRKRAPQRGGSDEIRIKVPPSCPPEGSPRRSPGRRMCTA